MPEVWSKTYEVHFWDEIEEWDLSSFNEIFTLHDSHLTDLLISPFNGIICSIQWDTVWNKGFPEGYDTLVIYIPLFYSNTLYNYNIECQCIMECESSIISEEERLQLIDLKEFDAFTSANENELQHPAVNPATTLTKMYILSGNFEILHPSPVKIVVMNDMGDFLPVKRL